MHTPLQGRDGAAQLPGRPWGEDLEIEDKVFQIEEMNRQLKSLAETDGLTGAYNRRFFDEYFRLETSRLSSIARHRPGSRAESGSASPCSTSIISRASTISGVMSPATTFLKAVVEIVKRNVFGATSSAATAARNSPSSFTSTDSEGLLVAAEKIRASIAEHRFIVGRRRKSAE